MKRLRRVVVTILLGASATASADSAKPVDITAVTDKLTVLTDNKGHYIVVQKQDGSEHFYYGDGKTMIKPVDRTGQIYSNGTRYRFIFTDYRVRPNGWGELQWRKGKWSVSCDREVETRLSEVVGAARSKLINGAKFMRKYWAREEWRLARNDDGVYYYVDKQAGRYSRGHQLFVGKRGKMKRVRLTNVVIDTAGEIYITKRGKLFISRKYVGTMYRLQAHWQAKGSRKRNALTYVSLEDQSNLFLVYAELAYPNVRFHTPCDDL